MLLNSIISANTMLQKMTEIDFTMAPEIITGFWKVFAVMLVGFIIHWLPTNWKEWYRSSFAKAPIVVQIIAALIVIIVLKQVVSADFQPFIYFQF